MSSDPKWDKLNTCWNEIHRNPNAIVLIDRDNEVKWNTISFYVPLTCLIKYKADLQAELVRYYIRLSTAEPTENIKEHYHRLMDGINELVGLLYYDECIQSYLSTK